MKREIALAVAIALSSTVAIAADKSDRDSTKTDATEQLKPGQQSTSPGAGSGSKDRGTESGAAGRTGPESSTGGSTRDAVKKDADPTTKPDASQPRLPLKDGDPTSGGRGAN